VKVRAPCRRSVASADPQQPAPSARARPLLAQHRSFVGPPTPTSISSKISVGTALTPAITDFSGQHDSGTSPRPERSVRASDSGSPGFGIDQDSILPAMPGRRRPALGSCRGSIRTSKAGCCMLYVAQAARPPGAALIRRRLSAAAAPISPPLIHRRAAPPQLCLRTSAIRSSRWVRACRSAPIRRR